VDNQLPVPPSARSDRNARELVRAWAAHGGLHCSLNVESWGDEERTAWGILLTDLVRHVANALNEAKGWDKAETVQQIRRVFNAELDSPTADAS
jgi:uncharacterized protein DUF5076